MIYMPDYNNCILNIVTSIIKHYGVYSEHKGSKLLDDILANKKYKNIVLMSFDGMGSDMLNHNLSKDSFFIRNKKADISSVYPCTTTAAMTAYYSGQSPVEHSWLGWSCYFKEFGRCIELYTNNDYYSQTSVGEKSAAYTLMPYKTIYDKIAEASGGSIKVHTIFPDFDPNGVENTTEMCERIIDYCNGEESTFIHTYWPEPDHSMHINGCYSQEAKDQVELFNNQIEELCRNIKDTLLIISADHGQTNIKREVAINEIPELDECLIMPPSMEARAASFFIKPNMHEIFKERFNKLFGDCYILFSKEEVLNKKLLGMGIQHPKVDDFLGDFLACATSDTMISYKTINYAINYKFAGHHAGLTKEEMEVPLIIIEK